MATKVGDKYIPEMRRRNPGVKRDEFLRLQDRVAALEAMQDRKPESEADGEREALVLRAKELKLAAPSIIDRWSVDKLKAEIAASEKKE